MLRKIRLKPAGLFLLSIFLTALSCLYPGCEVLIFISFFPLFLSFNECLLRPRLLTGISAGFGLSVFLLYWLSEVTLGGAFLFCLWNALDLAVIALLWGRFHSSLSHALIFSFCEWMREVLLPGSSFGFLGLILADYPLLIQIAAIGGLPFMGFWIIGVNYSVFKCWISEKGNRRIISGLGLAFWIAVPLFYGGIRLQEKAPHGEVRTLRIGMIQPNIRPADKWNVSCEKEIFSVLERLSMELKVSYPDVLLWPETAIPVSWEFNSEAGKLIKRVKKNLQCPILFGSIDCRTDNYYNAVFHADQTQSIPLIYHKINLVPFGEYIPLADVFPFLKNVIPLPYPFAKGERNVSFRVNGIKILPLICFEDTLSRFVQKAVFQEKPDLIAVFTNDGWFKGLGGPLNHDRLARFRAVENAIPVVRCTNTGVSSILDSRGRVLEKISVKGKMEGIEGAMVKNLLILPPVKTFFSRAGGLWLALCFFCSICLEIIFRKRKKEGRI